MKLLYWVNSALSKKVALYFEPIIGFNILQNSECPKSVKHSLFMTGCVISYGKAAKEMCYFMIEIRNGGVALEAVCSALKLFSGLATLNLSKSTIEVLSVHRRRILQHLQHLQPKTPTLFLCFLVTLQTSIVLFPLWVFKCVFKLPIRY